MRRLTALALSTLVLAALAVPAGALDLEVFEPVLIDTPTFLVCEGSTKLTQANFIADGTEFTTWDDTEPTASVQGGGGCGNADSFITGAETGNPFYDLPLGGQFDGNIDAITVELHALTTTARAFGEARLLVDLTIGSKQVLTDAQIDAPFVTSATGASQMVQFTITDIGLLEEKDLRKHNITMTVKSRFADASLVNGWVWDAVEVPSGPRFKPEELSETVINS